MITLLNQPWAERLGWTRIPAVVREVDDRTLLTLALIENLQRHDLSPIDEAKGYRRLGDEFLTHGLRTEPTNLREFLTIAGARVPDKGPLPDEVVRSIRRAQGSRPPSEASPPLEVLREAGIRSLVASGDHHVAVERMCDAVATVLGAQRMIAPGAGHFVAAAPGFAHELESF